MLRAKPKIKAPKKLTQPHHDTFDRLATAIKEIQHKNASRPSFEEHYRYAYTLVLHKQGQLLYDGLRDLVAAHLEEEARNRIEPSIPSMAQTLDDAASQISNPQGESFLNALRGVWDDHTACMSKLKGLLKYMDKVYVPSVVPPLQPSYALGLTLFLQCVIRNKTLPIRATLIAVLLSQIALDRQGQVVNKSSLRSCISMLSILRDNGREDGPSVYKTEFEQPFLQETRTFYDAESNDLLLTGTAPDYLTKVERRLLEEDERVHHYLSPSTEPALVSLLEHTLIASKLPSVLEHTEGGLTSLLDHKRVSDLARLYRLSARVGDGHVAVRKALKAWIIKAGQQLVPTASTSTATQKDDRAEEAAETSKGKGKESAVAPAVALAINWVTRVLELKDDMDQLWRDAWQEDLAFQTTIVEAFESFINQQQKAAEYISLFLDDNLRRGLKGKSENEVELVLDKAIVIFRFLSNKDLFETYYRRHLARRLLSQRSVSDDAERGLLSKLKIESGASFVRDLEGMIKDMKLSSDTSTAYKDHLRTSNVSLPLELSVQVCTSSHWPLAQNSSSGDTSAIFPELFVKSMKSFENFYYQRHSGRKLTWRPELGNVDVKVQFKARKHELNVTTQAMIVLSLFDTLSEQEQLDFKTLQSSTALSSAELRRTLQTLACGKHRILTKTPKSKEVNETDTFAFNDGFTSPLARIKIAQIANRVETPEEGKDTRAKVDEERKFLARACIVRVMKDRRQMTHVELTNEVIQQLMARFRPAPLLIKQQIEVMLEQEYIERDESDRKILRYLA